MSKLIYFTPMSLDGFLAGETDSMDWAVPDREVSAFINDRTRPVGTYLYGRKIYEAMKVWETPEVVPGLTPELMEFARIWQAADKIVYSKSLETVSTPNTRLEWEFDPQMVRDLKAQLPHDISVDGANLAAQVIRAGLVDEYELLVVPFMLGGGTQVLPDNVRINLELLDERRIGNGWVYLRYRSRD
ncbi:dihydrofolate reductase family protein [Aggregatilinea lenta]|uniref:dihydrofolate reductase family protein n=1 Tax=Aggregatilinea lenta TaxID=913108 RepID=UPI000E5AE538|nr:dihydrofolate reductase family protein [Aggregatilinea lenta]